MKLAILSFFDTGAALGERLSALLTEQGHQVEHSQLRTCGYPLAKWTELHFSSCDGLIFIGAAGIAVRAIAPYVKDKTTDPAVLVLDEGGNFVISLLSGHIGGANQLSRQIAPLLGATPVITTATDVHGLFAVDSFATERGLIIHDTRRIKSISSQIVAGNTLDLYSEIPITGTCPKGIRLVDTPQDCHIYIGIRQPQHNPMWLVPKTLSVGIGCRKDISLAAIEKAVETALEGFHPRAVKQVCTIDLKAGEEALVAFCHEKKLPLVTFTPEELDAVPGNFTASTFVQSVTGVDNVCERSAVLGSQGGTLLMQKLSLDGVTVAVAEEALTLSFDTE